MTMFDSRTYCHFHALHARNNIIEKKQIEEKLMIPLFESIIFHSFDSQQISKSFFNSFQPKHKL